MNDQLAPNRPAQAMPEDQPESWDEPETDEGQEAPESSNSAPRLQLITAGSEFACTSDGCAVTFTKG